MPDLPKGTKIPISVEEWKAFTSWLIQNKYPLPAQAFNGQISVDEPQYQAWVSAGKAGYVAPPSTTKQLYDPRAPWGWNGGVPPSGVRNFAWTPPNQGGISTQPTSVSTGEIVTADQAGLDAIAMEKRLAEYQLGEGQRAENATTIADARLRYREYADWQRQMALRERDITANAQQSAWDTAQQRFAAKDVGMQNQNAELQRQVNEMQFERDRERLLSGIPGNDWITKYTLQNQPNPYKKPEVSPIDQLETNLDSLTGTIQKYETEAVLAANAEAAGQPYHITSEQANEVVASNKERRDALYSTWKTVQDESVGWSPQPVPQPYPATPDWLPQYAPGLQVGRMITKQNVPTPSGQQLTAMPTDQLQQLGYYGKWTGQIQNDYPWKTLTESANLMQPQTPAGAGRFGWQANRQG